LESLRSADGLELVRGVAERMLQELIEAEATARIGADWNEHTETRTALRNGHRDKTLSTQAGDLDLAIPKLRPGSFFPALLERRRRIDQALYAVIIPRLAARADSRRSGKWMRRESRAGRPWEAGQPWEADQARKAGQPWNWFAGTGSP
jgi:transposase-like protein